MSNTLDVYGDLNSGKGKISLEDYQAPICHECADKNNLKLKGTCGWWTGKCAFCDKEACLCAVRDYYNPASKTIIAWEAYKRLQPEPVSSKAKLANNLEQLMLQMQDSARLMRTIYNKKSEFYEHSTELLGAADLVADWIKGIMKEVKEAK